MKTIPALVIGMALATVPVTGVIAQGDGAAQAAEVSGGSTAPARAASRERIAGEDRYGTAIAVTQKRFRDQSVSTVFIASGENYPDAIAINALAERGNASQASSAVLLSPSSGLTPAVLRELKRIIKAEGKIVLVGGLQALSATVHDQIGKLIPDAKVSRVAGLTRVETALAIASESQQIQPVDEVIITPSDTYSIAMVAAPLAVKRHAVQLSSPSSRDGIVHPEVAAWLDRVRPQRVTVVGPAGFLAQLRHPNLSRITDQSRVTYKPEPCKPGHTCIDDVLAPSGPDQVIAEHIMVSEFADAADYVLIAGDAAVDGIAAGQFAAMQRAPILPITPGVATHGRYALILIDRAKRNQVTFWAIGGDKVIGNNVLDDLAQTFTHQ